MKKVIVLTLFTLMSLTCLSADVLPTGYHTVPRIITIANCSAYPDYMIIGYITRQASLTQYELVEIKENTAIDKGYKLNVMRLFTLKKSIVAAAGGVSALDLNAVAASIAPADFINPAPLLVKDNDPLKSEKIVYKIAGIVNNNLVLYIAEHTLEYANGHAPVTEYFDYTPQAN